MYIGRIIRYKGVFDIIEMAKGIEAKATGRVRREICGTGPDLEAIRRLREQMSLQGYHRPRLDFVRGLAKGLRKKSRLNSADAKRLYGRLAMTAAESDAVRCATEIQRGHGRTQRRSS